MCLDELLEFLVAQVEIVDVQRVLHQPSVIIIIIIIGDSSKQELLLLLLRLTTSRLKVT